MLAFASRPLLLAMVVGATLAPAQEAVKVLGKVGTGPLVLVQRYDSSGAEQDQIVDVATREVAVEWRHKRVTDWQLPSAAQRLDRDHLLVTDVWGYAVIDLVAGRLRRLDIARGVVFGVWQEDLLLLDDHKLTAMSWRVEAPPRRFELQLADARGPQPLPGFARACVGTNFAFATVAAEPEQLWRIDLRRGVATKVATFAGTTTAGFVLSADLHYIARWALVGSVSPELAEATRFLWSVTVHDAGTGALLREWRDAASLDERTPWEQRFVRFGAHQEVVLPVLGAEVAGQARAIVAVARTVDTGAERPAAEVDDAWPVHCAERTRLGCFEGLGGNLHFAGAAEPIAGKDGTALRVRELHVSADGRWALVALADSREWWVLDGQSRTVHERFTGAASIAWLPAVL